MRLAAARTSRCWVADWRVMLSGPHSSVSVWPFCWRRRSSSARRVGSASARNTASSSGWPVTPANMQVITCLSQGPRRNVSGRGEHAAMRPVLKAGLRAVWRDRDTLQIGVDPRRAVALSGMSDAARVIALLDGSRDWESVMAAGRDAGISVKTVQRVLGLLAAAARAAGLSVKPVQRVLGVLAAAALTYDHCDGGARTLARRRLAFVRVHR